MAGIGAAFNVFPFGSFNYRLKWVVWAVDCWVKGVKVSELFENDKFSSRNVVKRFKCEGSFVRGNEIKFLIRMSLA